MPSGFSAFGYFADLLVLTALLLPIYHLTPLPSLRRALLSVSGFYLLFTIAPRLALFYLLFWLAVWLAQQILGGRWAGGLPPPTFAAIVLATLAPMVVWKLFPVGFNIQFNLSLHHLAMLLPQPIGALDAVRDILIPIGLSFATFRALDLLIQTHLGLINALSLERVLFFGLFPPVQVIGPIIEYSEIDDHTDKKPRFDSQDLAAGAGRILIGMFKVFALAYPLQSTAEVFLHYDANPVSTLWLGLFLFALYFYLNFAGYSDIAIGAARLFGFRLKENFDNPYLRQNPSQYWAHWHMSLTRFCQRNVFVPMGGFRKKTQYLAIFATIMTIAMWHELSLALVVFGCYHASGLIAHRYWDNRRKANKQKPWTGPLGVAGKTVACFICIMLGYPLLMLPLGQIVPFYGALLGLG